MSHWSDEALRILKDGWAAGLSTKAIADKLNHDLNDSGYTKNSVVGKAHRLGLDPRESPIKSAKGKTIRMVSERLEDIRRRVEESAKIKAVRVVKPAPEKEPEMPRPIEPAPLLDFIEMFPLPEEKESERIAPPVPFCRQFSKIKEDGPPLTYLSPVWITPMPDKRQCCYLAGDEKPYRRCDGVSVLGRSYCPEHMTVCVVVRTVSNG